MKFILTTIAGVESLAKKEIEKCGGQVEKITDRIISFSGEKNLICKVNFWSRVGNKLYIDLGEKKNLKNFDDFFEFVESIDFKKYFKKNYRILVKAKSIRSKLSASQSLQSLGKKAMINSLVGKGKKYEEDSSLPRIEIFFLLLENNLKILLNTTGEALHKRGYRKNAGEAPIKENLAASLILLSNWNFRENFYDFFCGSGTIVIEALMIAKNIAPGLLRKFAFEDLEILEKNIILEERSNAESMRFNKKYNIFASDSDEKIIELAKKNSENIFLPGEINFFVKDFREFKNVELSGTFVSNPPYGERLKPENIKNIYNLIDENFRKNKNLKGGIISSFMEFDNLIKKDNYKKRKLYNGGEMCYFWKKKELKLFI